ncbi:MAG: GTPase [Desulfurococcales archaeon ex4484_58]|nr:MAG: GTPase [Desulfurococcales archaeon ex4484_58]
MPIIKMRENELIKLFGPMLVNVNSGEIEILNKKFREGDKIVIHKVRSYIVHALKNTELDINMGPDAQIHSVENNEPYLEWVNTVNEIVDNRYEKIIVLGGVDCGKSTYSILLINTSLEKNYKPALIDGDVGQADIGPPGFISMAYPEQQVIWMRELKPVSMRFIGDIKPQYLVGTILLKMKELIGKAREDNRYPIVIDTDGWIGDEYALNYKQKMINEIKPDVIVILGEEYRGLFKKYERIGIKVYELRTPSVRRVRTRDERRMLRREKYMEYLGEPRKVSYPLDNIVVYGHPLFYGIEQPLKGDINVDIASKILYLTKSNDTLYLVASAQIRNDVIASLKNIYGVNKVKIYTEGFERNLYIALSDGFEDYPGLIEKIDFRERIIVVKTKYNVESIKWIKFSNIRLNDEFLEQNMS